MDTTVSKTTDVKSDDMSSKKIADSGGTTKPVDLGYTKVKPGDAQTVNKVLTEAKASGGFKIQGKQVPWDSAQGKGEIAKLQALGRGADPVTADRVGKLTQSQAENIARAKAVQANMAPGR